MIYSFDVVREAGDVTKIMSYAGIFSVLAIVISLFFLVCNWKLYTKAGQAGWKSLVPIYSNIVLLNIAGLSGWYFLLNFVPFANIYVMFKMNIELAHKFGKSTVFGVAMVFFNFICLPILAFGKCKYEENLTEFQSVYNQPQQPYNQGQMLNNSTFDTNSTNKICPYCRAKVGSNDKFCIRCGNRFL